MATKKNISVSVFERRFSLSYSLTNKSSLWSSCRISAENVKFLVSFFQNISQKVHTNTPDISWNVNQEQREEENVHWSLKRENKKSLIFIQLAGKQESYVCRLFTIWNFITHILPCITFCQTYLSLIISFMLVLWYLSPFSALSHPALSSTSLPYNSNAAIAW